MPLRAQIDPRLVSVSWVEISRRHSHPPSNDPHRIDKTRQRASLMLIRKSPVVFLLLVLVPDPNSTRSAAQAAAPSEFGYADFSKEAALETKFLDVPSAKLAGEELKTLTAEPHMAATPEDHKTAEYVAEKFRAAGLETEIVPFRVLLNQPKVVTVQAY